MNRRNRKKRFTGQGQRVILEKKSGNSHFPVNEEFKEIRWTEKSLTVI